MTNGDCMFPASEAFKARAWIDAATYQREYRR